MHKREEQLQLTINQQMAPVQNRVYELQSKISDLIAKHKQIEVRMDETRIFVEESLGMDTRRTVKSQVVQMFNQQKERIQQYVERIEINQEIERKKMATNLEMLVGKFSELEEKDRIEQEERESKKMLKRLEKEQREDKKIEEIRFSVDDQSYKFGVMQKDLKTILEQLDEVKASNRKLDD